MTSTDPQPAMHPKRNLKVPRTDQAWMMVPPATQAAELLQSNAKRLAEAERDMQGCSLKRLRSWTREVVYAAARDYTGQWADVPLAQNPADLWIVGGHQPTLFHPGVWAKNFAMGRLARESSAVSLNLVVDNDTLSSKSIRVPTGSFANPSVTDVPFDRMEFQQPWDQVTVQDQNLFESFAERVVGQLQGWKYSPLIREYWPSVVDWMRHSPRVADGFTAARNQRERQWGTENLELPLSQLCSLPPFLWFVTHIVAHLPRFWRIYNQAVRDYRKRNGIHGTSHPVPELVQIDDWQEAPFWVWRTGDRRRSRLFARRRGRGIELAVDGKEPLGELPLTTECEAREGMVRLQDLQAGGLHLRTRALTTTLFSRICLADLFVHGIGGSKYDEITDDLIAQFWGLPVPGYWTVSGSLHLPLGAYPSTLMDLDRSRSRLRDLQWNPTRTLADSTDARVQRLRHTFDEVLARPTASRHDQRIKHRDLTEVKRALDPWAKAGLPEARARLEEVSRELAANRILQDREYSFVLFPEAKLREFLTGPLA